jgi:hypothetical protein
MVFVPPWDGVWDYHLIVIVMVLRAWGCLRGVAAGCLHTHCTRTRAGASNCLPQAACIRGLGMVGAHIICVAMQHSNKPVMGVLCLRCCVLLRCCCWPVQIASNPNSEATCGCGSSFVAKI